MKNIYIKTSFLLVGLIFCAVAFAQNPKKVSICHIPPGNPENAHTITVSTNAVNAHLNGNNQHNDFLGDCWAGCVAEAVVQATQGKQSNGTAVPLDRSNQSKVLGTPDKNNTAGEFYSLGFGGEIILRMDGGILNRPGNDLYVYESSFGQPDCSDYPEKAEIFVSTDMSSWTSLGVICADGAVDIAPLDWIMYVKVKDVSNPLDFSEVVDGFDLDGIQCIRSQQKSALEGKALTIYPNPVSSQMNIDYKGLKQGQSVVVEVFNQMGKQVLTTEIKTASESGSLLIPMNTLSQGIYSVRISGTDLLYVEQFLKK